MLLHSACMLYDLCDKHSDLFSQIFWIFMHGKIFNQCPSILNYMLQCGKYWVWCWLLRKISTAVILEGLCFITFFFHFKFLLVLWEDCENQDWYYPVWREKAIQNIVTFNASNSSSSPIFGRIPKEQYISARFSFLHATACDLWQPLCGDCIHSNRSNKYILLWSAGIFPEAYLQLWGEKSCSAWWRIRSDQIQSLCSNHRTKAKVWPEKFRFLWVSLETKLLKQQKVYFIYFFNLKVL